MIDGFCFAENLIDARRVLHIADKSEKRHVRKCVAEFLLQAIQRIFVLFEEDDTTRLEACDLPAQLGPDRPAGTGYQYRPTRKEFSHTRRIDPNRFAAKQIFEIDLANV